MSVSSEKAAPSYSGLLFAVSASLAAFGTYFSMYAFRKPFTAASFEGVSLWGMDYKIVLVVSQVFGYMLSKFIGIKVISELKSAGRIRALILLLSVAQLALIGFALTPAPWNFGFMFINGMPLGMIFGVVFSYLEGRRITELLSIGLSVSIIIASGAMKTVGKLLLDDWGVSQWWMPAVAGMLFIPLLVFSLWLLSRIPPPTADDIAARTVRPPMTAADRRALFLRYWPGLLFLIGLYILLTAFRDMRDSFAVEIWSALGYAGRPTILTQSEVIIALFVLVYVALISFVKDNTRAFFINHAAIGGGGLLLGLSTILFQMQLISPLAWMVTGGFGLFLGYTIYQGMLFERMIAALREQANVGFLMYLADSYGYLGSVAVLLTKNFAAPKIAWLRFFTLSSYILAISAVVISFFSYIYFRKKTLSKVKQDVSLEKELFTQV